MAMNINLTLVVQVINFIIAYVLISRLFLKPGYRALRVDEDRIKQLHDAVSDEQQVLAQKELYKKERWRLCQNYFATHRPPEPDGRRGMESIAAVEPIQQLSAQDLSNMASAISTQIEERIRHD